MNKFIKNLLIALFMFLVVAAIFSFTLGEDGPGSEVTLSKVAEQVSSGLVDKIDVSENKLTVYLKDGAKETATKEPQSDLIDILSSLNVSADSIKNANIQIKGPSGSSVLISAILPFLPVYLFSDAPGRRGQQPRHVVWTVASQAF